MKKWSRKKPSLNTLALIARKSLISKASLVLAFFVLLSCEKETDGLGSNVVDGEGFDSGILADIGVTAFSKPRDSIFTFQATRFVVGQSSDADFGDVSASVYTQLRPELTAPDFGPNPRIDSVVMTLVYEDPPFTANFSEPLTFEVHRLTEVIDRDELHTNLRTLDVESEALGTTTVIPNFRRASPPGDTTGINEIPPLRISLDNDYFDNLILQPSIAGTSELDNIENFLEYFKGLRIRTTAGDGFVYFNSFSTETAIRIYYSNDDTLETGMQFKLLAGNDNVFFMNYTHDLTNANARMDAQDTVNGMEVVYSSGMGGPIPYITIDDFMSLKDSLTVINRATLRVPIAPGSRGKFKAPNNLIGITLEDEAILDFQENIWSQNGQVFSGAFRQGYYEMNITRFLMDAIIEDKPLTLALLPQRGDSNASRVILSGNKSTDYPIEVRIIYSNSKN